MTKSRWPTAHWHAWRVKARLSGLNPQKGELEKQVWSSTSVWHPHLPKHLQNLKDPLLTSWCQILQHAFRVSMPPRLRAVLREKCRLAQYQAFGFNAKAEGYISVFQVLYCNSRQLLKRHGKLFFLVFLLKAQKT